ncbi:MAG: ABC-2 transporter permease [Collinsella sp.]|uniref:ABC-2 transporter permease n=1 Tax=Collinsella sp. TaxID=1965294 RepID=UPI003990A58F
MMRMFKMELAVFGQYLRQLAFSILFMTVCFTVGMGSTSMLPGIIFMMGMFSLSNSASHYDEQNDWAAFRLTMPVSRRDVVLGRYLFVLAGTLIASLFVSVAACLLSWMGGASLLPEVVANMVRLDADMIQAGVFALAFCSAMGFVTASVSMPVFFKCGQTKATQWLPFIMMFLGVAPLMVGGFMGEEAIMAMQQALSFAETPEGLTSFAMGALIFGVVCYIVSALVSLRVYKARDL